MNVLVFNVGSTTLKYACIDPAAGRRIAGGIVDRIGQTDGDAATHADAARIAIEQVGDTLFSAIGHRIVQGGDQFQQPTLVDAGVLDRLKQLDSLAPLHNPPARQVVESLLHVDVPQTLVFDTAYFATLLPDAYLYAIPEWVYRQHGVRKYGFHGTSHQFVTQRALEFLGGETSTLKIITMHLGGGASITASVGGMAVDTSMGMTPLEGLVMATRCGDIDAAVPLYLIREAGMTADEVDTLLNKQSGLVGLCGSSDMRTVLQRCGQGDQSATQAVEIYVRRIIKAIGSYYALLGGIDALVFTAGVGEHSAEIRQRVTSPLRHLGIAVDPVLNETCGGDVTEITAADATARTLVIPTDEELAIARQVRMG
ncbi:MAG: acetate/propionate family kinase [Fuerstiella sp.]